MTNRAWTAETVKEVRQRVEVLNAELEALHRQFGIFAPVDSRYDEINKELTSLYDWLAFGGRSWESAGEELELINW